MRFETNKDVLERIYNSNITSKEELPIEFFYVSDEEKKLTDLGIHLLTQFPNYFNFKVEPYDGIFELRGMTHKIQMELNVINKWNKIMWDIGYKFDCRLDGWQVEIN